MSDIRPDQNAPAAPLNQDEDPLWDLLGKASAQEPSPLFAKNVLRQTRQLPTQSSFTERLKEELKSYLSVKKIAISATAACACILVISQITSDRGNNNIAINETAQPVTPSAETDSITEFLLQETLLVAAEDPSQFTHDEVLAMIGF